MRKTLLASSVLVAFAATPAFADGGMTEGMNAGNYWYVGLSAGANFVHDIGPTTGTGVVLATDFDTGYALSATVGYHWFKHVRTEAEFTYRDNNAGKVVQVGFATAPNLGGGISQMSLMANVLYDFQLMDCVNLSVGAGAGASDADVDIQGFGNDLITDTHSGNWSFAWQLIAGLSYSLSPNTEFFTEYRYMRDDNHDVTTFPHGVPWQNTIDAQNQTVNFGVRFALGR